jgi:hypothetical protein
VTDEKTDTKPEDYVKPIMCIFLYYYVHVLSPRIVDRLVKAKEMEGVSFGLDDCPCSSFFISFYTLQC